MSDVFSVKQLYFWYNWHPVHENMRSFVFKNQKFGCIWPENPAEDTLVEAKHIQIQIYCTLSCFTDFSYKSLFAAFCVPVICLK